MLPTFEVLFGIPPHHRLWLVRSRGRGGARWGEYWTHEEVDLNGTVLARYESHEEVDSAGQVQRGWRTYDASGRFVNEQTIPDSGLVHSNSQPRLAA
jgi:hypothetical protein